MKLDRNKIFSFMLAAAFALTLAGCGGGGGTAEEPMETPDPGADCVAMGSGYVYEDGICLSPAEHAFNTALANIAAATTAADAQAAYDAVKGNITATAGDMLQAAVNARVAELETMARVDMQKTALANAAGMIDTSDLSTQAAIDAAEAAIAALEAALAAAADVSDADKAMYQGRVTAAETAVANAQSTLDHAAQTMALSGAVEALQAIDLTDLSTQEKIDAAQGAIDALQAALDNATELSAAEKTAAMTELATADRTVMTAQGRYDTAAQMKALADAVATLAALDLDNLVTQAQIDAAVAAITGVNLALESATNLTDAQKLDATVDVTVAQRKVDRAETTLATNVGSQRTALMTAASALGEIDLDDLDTAEKITAAQTAVDNLKAALDGATHLSDSEKAAYQTQLNEATETVRMAATGMERDERMAMQRTAITSAVTMARTAVAGVSDTSTDSEVAAADAAVAALKKAIDDAADLPEGDADVASAQGTLTTLEGQLASAKTSRTAALEEKAKADRAAMAKTGKDLHAALAGPADTNTALDNIAATSLDATGTMPLEIDAADGAGTLTTGTDDHAAVDLRTGDSAGSLGGWAGTDYARTTGAGEAMVTNEARVYVNKGPGRSRPFSGTNGAYTLVTAAGDDRGYLGSNATTLLDVSAAATDLAKVKADAFTHSGTQTHAVPDRSNAVYVRGTYDGAPGEFRCATAAGCSSTNDGTGSPSALGGEWYFKPDAGAMVNTPDAHYLYYGWWVRKDNDSKPTAASAFVGRVGTEPGDSTDGLDPGWDTTLPGTPGGLTGSATYAGHAAGKYAINNVLEASGHGGHFTADAEFEAKFSGSNAGIKGTIDNFRLNDGTEDPDWSVSLRLRGWAAAGGGAIGDAIDDPTTPADESAAGAGTVWSIGGNPAGASGTWGGTMYDEKPGNPSATGPGDGSNIPTTVTGTFYSEFSTIGRMVGAFGADKQ